MPGKEKPELVVETNANNTSSVIEVTEIDSPESKGETSWEFNESNLNASDFDDLAPDSGLEFGDLNFNDIDQESVHNSIMKGLLNLMDEPENTDNFSLEIPQAFKRLVPEISEEKTQTVSPNNESEKGIEDETENKEVVNLTEQRLTLDLPNSGANPVRILSYKLPTVKNTSGNSKFSQSVSEILPQNIRYIQTPALERPLIFQPTNSQQFQSQNQRVLNLEAKNSEILVPEYSPTFNQQLKNRKPYKSENPTPRPQLPQYQYLPYAPQYFLSGVVGYPYSMTAVQFPYFHEEHKLAPVYFHSTYQTARPSQIVKNPNLVINNQFQKKSREYQLFLATLIISNLEDLQHNDHNQNDYEIQIFDPGNRQMNISSHKDAYKLKNALQYIIFEKCNGDIEKAEAVLNEWSNKVELEIAKYKDLPEIEKKNAINQFIKNDPLMIEIYNYRAVRLEANSAKGYLIEALFADACCNKVATKKNYDVLCNNIKNLTPSDRNLTVAENNLIISFYNKTLAFYKDHYPNKLYEVRRNMNEIVSKAYIENGSYYLKNSQPDLAIASFMKAEDLIVITSHKSFNNSLGALEKMNNEFKNLGELKEVMQPMMESLIAKFTDYQKNHPQHSAKFDLIKADFEKEATPSPTINPQSSLPIKDTSAKVFTFQY